MSLPSIATKKQLQAYEYGKQNPYSILAMDMRMGKSLVAIALRKYRKCNCLIICPSYLILNWKKEIEKWDAGATITMFRKGKDIYNVFDTDFVITSFELSQKSKQVFFWADQVIVDEAHNLKSMAAKRTEFIHQQIYENSVKYVHLLTGTPLKNRVREFYSLLAMMNYNPQFKDPAFLKEYPDEITFAEKFAYRSSYNVQVTTKRGAKFSMPVVKYEGLRNIDKLKESLKGIYIRIRADLSDLPPIQFKDILISDTPNKKLLDAFEAWINTEGNESVKPDIKVQAAMQKVPFTIKYVENLLENGIESVLVYSDHTEPINKIAAHFKVPAITGKMLGNKRSKLVKEFQEGKLNILCATIGSLKEGADLYRAKDLVLSDISWVPSDVQQVIARMQKIGKKDPCTVHRILGSPQDNKIYDALLQKQKIIDKAT